MSAISSINEQFAINERPSLRFKSSREENLSLDSGGTTVVASSVGNRAMLGSELASNEIHKTQVSTQNGKVEMLITGPSRGYGLGNDALVVSELAEGVTLVAMFNGIPDKDNKSPGAISREAALSFIRFDPESMNSKHAIERHLNSVGEKMASGKLPRAEGVKGDAAVQVAVVSKSDYKPEKYRRVDFYTCGAVYGQYGDSIIIEPDGSRVVKGFDASQHSGDVYGTGLKDQGNNISHVGYNTVPIGSKIVITNRNSYVGRVNMDPIQYIEGKAQGNRDATDLGVVVLTIE
jgi:hypothetical protein